VPGHTPHGRDIAQVYGYRLCPEVTIGYLTRKEMDSFQEQVGGYQVNLSLTGPPLSFQMSLEALTAPFTSIIGAELQAEAISRNARKQNIFA